MKNEPIRKQLLDISGTISRFKKDTCQSDIVKSLLTVFDIEGYHILNVIDYDNFYFSDEQGVENCVDSEDYFKYLKNGAYCWSIDDGPYIGSYESYSITGIRFVQQTWGVYLSKKPLSKENIDDMVRFAKSVTIWFDSEILVYPEDVFSPVDLKLNKKLAALQQLYSIEWEWEFKTNTFKLSSQFLNYI